MENIAAPDHVMKDHAAPAKCAFQRVAIVAKYKRTFFVAIELERSTAVSLMLLRMALLPSRNGQAFSSVPIHVVGCSIAASTLVRKRVISKMPSRPIVRGLPILSPTVHAAKPLSARSQTLFVKHVKILFQTAPRPADRFSIAVTSASSRVTKENAFPA